MYLNNPKSMEPYTYFAQNIFILKKQYDTLRAFFYEKRNAAEVASTYGYTLSAFYSLTRDFRKYLRENPTEDFFFKEPQIGRKPTADNEDLNTLIINLRKKNFSHEDIVTMVNTKEYNISYGYVYQLLRKEGFARLLRRGKSDLEKLELPRIEAPISQKLKIQPEKFTTNSIGIFCFLPYIMKYNIDQAIEQSLYPATKMIPKLPSILTFIALKVSNIRRYSVDDIWCMDRGLGLFAILNALPKTAWLTSYSSRITSDMNIAFLKSLHDIWLKNDLLSDTCNLDFTTIPYWGDDEHLENNWSGKRNKALASILTVIAQDSDSGIIDYGDANILHKNQSAVVLEYLDFYHSCPEKNKELKYLVFDSRFTNYENLSKLDEKGIKFITIRRRGKNIVEYINNIPKNQWKIKRVEQAGLKKRTLKVYEETIKLQGYKDTTTGKRKEVRQIAITGHGKIKPALIITNDFHIETNQIVRKYCRRWLVEKGIAEQVEFFHLNRVSSSMVIKVDFDLTMTILAHNLYRLLALDLDRYENLADQKIFEKFINNSGKIAINHDKIILKLKKKRDLPQLLEMMSRYKDFKYKWLGNRKLEFVGSSTS